MSRVSESVGIDNFPINPHLISKLKNANFIFAKNVLKFSQSELQRIAKISANEASIVFQAASTAELKSSDVDALSMLNSFNASMKYQVPFEFFNSVNFHGVYSGTITEIHGESGSGKTQLCLLLSICTLVPENPKEKLPKVLYVHSEGEFPIQRFVELSEFFKKKNPSCKKINFMDNMILKKVYNLKETIRVLQTGIPELQKQNKFPKVIIIDSVAELLRGEYDSYNTRNLMIQQLTVELWKLANIHGIAVICVNQVSGCMQKSANTLNISSTDIPSLGLMWANVLTTRLKVFRRGLQDESVVRAFEVVYSSYHPRMIIEFVITSEGVEVLKEYLL